MAAVFRRRIVGKMPRNFCYCDNMHTVDLLPI